MDVLEAHGKALAEFDRRVRTVADDRWSNATPCTDWAVSDLVNHLVSEQLWAPWLLRGATIEEVGDRFDGDQLGDDPKAAWAASSLAAREAWLAADLDSMVHVSFGRIETVEYGWQMTLDLTVHAWDLARGIGADEEVDREVCAELFSRMAPQVDAWQDAGIFAPPVDVPSDADPQTRLLAIVGRTI